VLEEALRVAYCISRRRERFTDAIGGHRQTSADAFDA
jgi:hypothetical protein